MSINCIIDDGYALGCASVGGVDRVWIGNWTSDMSYTFDATDVITGVTSASTVYVFEQDIEYAGVNQNGVFNRANGTVHQESVLSIKMTDLTAELRNTALALAKAPVYAIVRANTGRYFTLGVESAGRATESALTLGVAMEDMNGASLSFTFKSQNGIYLIDGALIGTSIAVGS
jgi:hypothetical protein